MKRFSLLARVLLLFIVASSSNCRNVDVNNPAVRGNASVVLSEANETFTYAGKPIHPMLLREFEGWVSDAGPINLSVDVSAAEGTDEYSAPVRQTVAQVTSLDPDAKPQQWYSYERIGVLRDGTQVVVTSQSGGGSGVFKNLLLIRFSEIPSNRSNADYQSRLVMSLTDSHTLGDRSRRSIEVLPDRVVIGPRRSGDAKTVLTGEAKGDEVMIQRSKR